MTIPTSGKGSSSQKEVVSLRLKLQYQVSSTYTCSTVEASVPFL